MLVAPEFAQLGITSESEGINPGDRRAVYYLTRYLCPRDVLEIGTHIGASTTHVAVALRQLAASQANRAVSLTTVDVEDINDSESQPWLKYGSACSPLDMMKRLRCDGFVTFVVSRSLDYFIRCTEKFDLIFLDGDHSAATVYQEIPSALKLLKSGGWILLHDYYPDLKPLVPTGKMVPGPYLAVRRLQREGVAIRAVPLGRLPWTTKQNSNLTSLALLGKFA
jgi:predicted O-methyltransferase YrrM